MERARQRRRPIWRPLLLYSYRFRDFKKRVERKIEGEDLLELVNLAKFYVEANDESIGQSRQLTIRTDIIDSY